MKNVIFFCLAFACLNITNTRAQVLIGESATDTPSKGAILELQSKAGYGGLLLPRIGLTSISTWSPLGNSEADAVNGMVVYNSSTSTNNGLIGPGLYVWNSSWNLISSGAGVNVPVQTINISPASISFGAIGQTQQLTATGTPSNASDPSVTWTSTDPTVATVDSKTGLVIAIKNGSTTIAATATSGVTQTCGVSITGIPVL